MEVPYHNLRLGEGSSLGTTTAVAQISAWSDIRGRSDKRLLDKPAGGREIVAFAEERERVLIRSNRREHETVTKQRGHETLVEEGTKQFVPRRV